MHAIIKVSMKVANLEQTDQFLYCATVLLEKKKKRCIKDWNLLKSDIKQSTPIDSFKQRCVFKPRFFHCIILLSFNTFWIFRF